MKKEFAQLVKDMRLAFHPEFKAIAGNANLSTDQFDKALAELEEKQKQMVIESGYTQTEFDKLCREHFMDFSSANSDEWVIRHDPDNAHIIVNH
jgi:hypothetical protein